MMKRARNQSTTRGLAAIGVLLLVAACSGSAGPPSSSPAAAAIASPAALLMPAATPTLTTSPAPSAPPPPATATPDAGPTPLDPGTHAAKVIGTGTYPGFTVVTPEGWYDGGGFFVLKYAASDVPGPVLGISVWDVGQVFHDPCHWQGKAFDPGPSVTDLVTALVAQPMRNATKPKDATLAGYSGRSLELSVPADMMSSRRSQFDACDLEADGVHRDFQGWLGNGMGNRYEQVPGQVDRLWILDVNGQRLLVDATYSPDTTPADRAEQEQIVQSLRFVAP